MLLHLKLDYFFSKPDAIFSTLVWLLSIILLIFSVIKIDKKFKQTHKNHYLHLYEKIGLALIVFFAFSIRFSRIKYFGFYEIEWYWLQEAKRIISGFISPFGSFGDFPSNNLAFPIAFLLTCLKDRFLIIRLPNIFYSILTIIFTFKYLRIAFNKSVAFISAIFLSFSIWDIHSQSLGWQNSNSIPFFISSNMFFLYSGFQSNYLISILIAGIISGAAINTLYIPSLIVIPSAFFLLAKIYSKNTRRFATLSLFVYLITIIFITSPNIAKIHKYPSSVLRQKKSFSVNYKHFAENKNNNYYINQISIVFKNIIYNKDKFSDYGLWVTTLDPVISIFVIIGFVYFLTRITSINYLFTFLNFLIMFVPIVVFDREGSTWREFGLFSGIYMIASVTIFYAFQFVVKKIRLSKYWPEKIISLILVVYLVIFGFLFSYYSKSQYVNKQNSEESFFVKNADNLKKLFSKKTEVYFTDDYPGRVSGITAEETFNIKYFSNIQDVNINKRPLAIVLSFGKNFYWANQMLNQKNFEEYMSQTKKPYKIFRLNKNLNEYTLIYYFN